MNETCADTRQRYFAELGVQLKQAGFMIQDVDQDGLLPVKWQGHPLCRISGEGGARYRPDDMTSPEVEAAKGQAVDIARVIAEYMKLMEWAPRLAATGLDGDYRVLADFNGTVLAGHPTQYGVEFITWDRDYDHTGVSHGNYFTFGAFDAAKQDFAVRAGLVQKDALFTPEQLTDLYDCLRTMQGSDGMATHDFEKRLEDLQKQLERLVPGVQEHGQLKIKGTMTVREFLTRHPEATVTMMTPCGYCTLTPDSAKRALAGEDIITDPGVADDFMKEDADIILGEEIVDAYLSKGIWHMLTDYPEQKMQPPKGLEMGGMT